MSENLYQATHEWATRPDDERFWSLDECLQAARIDRETAAVGTVKAGDLRVVANEGSLLLEGERAKATLNNWSFGQLAARAGAPAGYLASLPATLAAQNLNHGLKNQNGEQIKLLLRSLPPGDGLPAYSARAITSGRYERLWDETFLKGFIELEQKHGWRIPPARPYYEGGRSRLATEADVLQGGKMGLSIKVGDPIGPAGVYRGDRDMFVFMVDDNHVIESKGEKLARGFFFWNSEVGARSFGATTFLYRAVCGNHIVWGAERQSEIRFRHVGDRTQRRASRILEVEVRRYLDSSSVVEAERIGKAQTFRLGSSKDEALSFLQGKRSITLPQRTLEAAYTSTVKHPEDGDPLTAWGMAQGVTRLSQAAKTQDARSDMDRQAGKILEFAF